MLSFGVVITGVVITIRNVKLFFLEKIECCLLVLS